MENKLGDLESLPDLFGDTGNEIDFVHSTSSESSDDSFIQNLRIQERDQTPKKARKIVANPMKWKYTATGKMHFLVSTTCRLLTAKPKRLRTEQRVESEEDDCMEDEDEAETNTPTQDQRGKNGNSRRVPKGYPVLVREHMKSFSVVESHYCRAHTKREYLGSHLSIGKMYELYLQQCCTEKITAVRKLMNYRIFVSEFNLGFHSPKGDRCDLCKKFKVQKQTQTLTDDIKYEYHVHQTSKMNMREVRNEEKKTDLSVLLFDFKNVIPTPHVNICSLFYLRKLKVYNLTAYYTPTKQVYCAL
ncbi:hypothetical protein AVEN_243724-1 [Araneus ventricosus]|uniref:Uncharacterized protein n=1 Tax=Araneus ventricosus TaxID=182803 RepID=A0A4Y2A683_ARAVE|nr:hypothetical protein AVEN_243724-1 [Araneus ventricosus]